MAEKKVEEPDLKILHCNETLFKTKQVSIGSKKDKILDKQFKWDYQEYHTYNYPAQIGVADQYGIY